MDVKGKPLYFIVLANVFHCTKKLHELYDLKGSIIGRELKTSEKEQLNNGETVVMKDYEFVQNKRKITFGEKTKLAFLRQLEEDCRLMENFDIMDYSLLVGVHKLHDQPPRELPTLEKNSPLTKSTKEILKRVPSLVFFCEDEQEIILKPPKPFRLKPEKRKKSLSFSYDDRTQNHSIPKVAGAIPSFATDGTLQEYYYFGIIDILQKYDSKMKISKIAKTLRFGKEEDSTADPHYYSMRFKDFIAKSISEPVRNSLRSSSSATASSSSSPSKPKVEVNHNNTSKVEEEIKIPNEIKINKTEIEGENSTHVKYADDV